MQQPKVGGVFLFRHSEDFMRKLNVMSKMTLLSNEDADAEVEV